MHGYNPYAAQQPSYGLGSQSPANMIFMPNGQQNSIAASTYGMPLTCVCTPNQNAGLNFYGGGSSAIPMMGQAGGQSSVYNVPGTISLSYSETLGFIWTSSRFCFCFADNVPIEGVLRQLGVDPSTLQRSSSNIPLGTCCSFPFIVLYIIYLSCRDYSVESIPTCMFRYVAINPTNDE